MPDLESPPPETSRPQEDGITPEPAMHPVATGVGAAGGGATGAAVGLLVGGPVGGVIGAVIGAVAGGLGGNAIGEAADPTILDEPTADQTTPHHANEYVIACDGHWERREVEFTPLVAEPRAPISPFASVTAASTISEPNHEDIAVRAWSYYADEGLSDGHDLDHWLRAESELRRESHASAPH